MLGTPHRAVIGLSFGFSFFLYVSIPVIFSRKRSRYLSLLRANWFTSGALHFLDFAETTPGPPPFSSMNSTPAAWRAAKSLATVIEVSLSVSSARRIVVSPTADARARSALQRIGRGGAGRGGWVEGGGRPPSAAALLKCWMMPAVPPQVPHWSSRIAHGPLHTRALTLPG